MMTIRNRDINALAFFAEQFKAETAPRVASLLVRSRALVQPVLNALAEATKPSKELSRAIQEKNLTDEQRTQRRALDVARAEQLEEEARALDGSELRFPHAAAADVIPGWPESCPVDPSVVQLLVQLGILELGDP
jgi:hypothetical protein